MSNEWISVEEKSPPLIDLPIYECKVADSDDIRRRCIFIAHVGWGSLVDNMGENRDQTVPMKLLGVTHWRGPIVSRAG